MMELAPKDTKMIQGLSVLAMVWLHLFDRPYVGLFEPLLYFQGTPLSFYIAQLSDFCVFGFAFCSGYGHSVKYQKPNYYKNRLKGLLSVLCSFWLVLVLFCFVSWLMGFGSKMPGSFSKFLQNAFLLDKSYNGAWWYLFAYTLIVLLSPFILKISLKLNVFVILGCSLILYFVSFYVRFKLGHPQCWLLIKFGPFGMTLVEYIMGVLAYRTKIFSRIFQVVKNWSHPVKWIVSVLLLAVLLYARTKILPSLFFAPISGFIVITLFHFIKKSSSFEKTFLFIGKHSTNIWLTHMFFYLVIFKNLVYIAKYPIFIFFFMIVITTSLSICLCFVEHPIQRLVRGK